MTKVRSKAFFWISVTGLGLLVASLRFSGASPLLIVAVFAGVWFALTLGLALVGNRRYIRAFTRDDSQWATNPGGSGSLSIGWAIFVGEMVINVPVVVLAVGSIFAVAKLLEWITGNEVTGPVVAIPVIVGFVSAWGWWSIVTPRWLLWAMRRVDHPQALRNAAIGSILWDGSKMGAYLNRTLLQTAAMKAEEKELLRRKVQKSAN